MNSMTIEEQIRFGEEIALTDHELMARVVATVRDVDAEKALANYRGSNSLVWGANHYRSLEIVAHELAGLIHVASWYESGAPLDRAFTDGVIGRHLGAASHDNLEAALRRVTLAHRERLPGLYLQAKP